MKPGVSSPHRIVYKWISYCLLVAFIYYWIFTIGMLFNRNGMSNVLPRQTALYTAFLHQDWQLFSGPKLYNRQLNFIVRDKQHPEKADTTDIVQYLLTKKRKYAPFNNYEDALDHMLYVMMNRFEKQLNTNKDLLKKQFPGQPDSVDVQKVSRLTETDSVNLQNLQNLIAFGKHVMLNEKKDTAKKEYYFTVAYQYILPQHPSEGSLNDGNIQTIFISACRSF
jgi:hypothetical protein